MADLYGSSNRGAATEGITIYPSGHASFRETGWSGKPSSYEGLMGTPQSAHVSQSMVPQKEQDA